MAGSVEGNLCECPNRPTLEALVNLPPDNLLAANLREHLQSCITCQKILDDITNRHALSSFGLVANIARTAKDSETIRRLVDKIERALRSHQTSTGTLSATTETAVRQEDTAPASLPDAHADSAPSPPSPDSAIPTTIGRYTILDVLGRGGTGVVYLAYDPQANRNIAIKILSIWHPSQQQRLQREAQAIARLQCEEVVKLHSVETTAAGQTFLTMEYVPGQTLAQHIARQTRLSSQQIVEIIVRVARGAQAAHDAGVLHRDIKPGNILLDQNDQAKLADFGMAQIADADASLTASGTIVGTLAYLSPEAVAGKSQDVRSDVYGLGCVLYETASGVPPFQGTAQHILRQISEIDPPLIGQFNPDFPADLEAICRKAMAKEPTGRYATAADLVDDLLRFQRGEPIAARPATWVEQSRKWIRRNRWQAATLAVLSLALCGSSIAVLLILQSNRVTDQLNQTLQQRNTELAASQQEADASFSLTRTGLISIVDRLKNELLQVPRAEQVSIESIRSATDLFQQLTVLRPDDQQVAVEYLQSLKDLWYAEWMYDGDAREELALSRFQDESIRLMAAFPDNIDIAALRAELLLDLAIESENAGDQEQAQRFLQDGQNIAARLLAQASDSLAVRTLTWKAAWQTYQAARRRGADPQEMVQRAAAAVRAQQAVVEKTPTHQVPTATSIWVDQLTRLAEAYVDNQQPTDALNVIEQAETLANSISDAAMTVEVRLAHARILNVKAQVARIQNDPAAEETWQQRRVGMYRELLDEFPESEVQVKCLAEALCDLVEFGRRMGKPDPDSLAEASALLDRVQSNPSVANWAENLRKKIALLQDEVP